MHSPRILEASEACSLCCPSPFPDPRTPNSSDITTESSSSRHDFAAAISSTLCPNAQFSNHESLPSFEDSISSFTKAYPQYNQKDQADQIRNKEYYHLALAKHVCLDYIGHGLFSYWQQRALSLQIQSPEASSSSTTQKSTDLQPPFFDISHKSTTLKSVVSYGSQESDLESRIRTRIMGFMNLSEEDYTMVFTANQASAFKVLADSYPFRSNRNLLTVYDHQSDATDVMIESSRKRGARVLSAEFLWPNLRVESKKLRKMIIGKGKGQKGLFVFPLRSRVTGARYAYRWMSLAKENGWDVLLDTCALGPKEMETLGLSMFQPDFLFCSCFKVFGENPSGFGCLFIRRSSASIFDDSSMVTSFGIVSLVPATKSGSGHDSQSDEFSSPKSLWDMLRDEGYASQENEEDVKGKRALSRPKPLINGGSRIECRGLDHADSLGLILIGCRGRYLINWLVNALMSLKHPDSGNGCSLVMIYGPKVKFERGPAVAFNLFDWKGEKIDPPLVQKLADRNNISLSYETLRHISFSKKYEERDKMSGTGSWEVDGTFVRRKKEKLSSEVFVVTAALGFLSNFEDVYRLWAFVSRFLDADFVEKERWRYTALNQKTVEV